MRKAISLFVLIFLSMVVSCSTKSNLADDFFNAGNYEKAITEYKKFIEENPRDWKAYARLGECYRNINQADLALDAYNKAFKLNPNSNNIKDNLKAIRTKASEKYFSEKRYDKVLELEPDDDVRLKISERFISEGEYNKAYKILDKLLKTDPNNIDVNYQFAVLYKETGRPEKAKIHFDKIIEIEPNNKEVLRELELISERRKGAEKYFRKGKELYDYAVYYESYETLKKSVDLKPDYKDAEYYMHLALGNFYLKKDDVIVIWEAIEEFGNAMEIYIKRAEPHYLLGLAYEKKDKKDYKFPIEEYNRAIELEPDSKIAEICKEKIKQFYKNKKEIEKMENFWRRK